MPETLAVLFSRGFPKSLHASMSIVLESRHSRFLPDPFQFVGHPKVHLLYEPGYVIGCVANLTAGKSLWKLNTRM